MALIESNQLHYQDAVRQLARDLDDAVHGTKGALKKGFMETYNISRNTLHKHLGSIGWASGRKTRSDCGTTSMSEEALIELAGMKRLGLRENGKDNMKTTTAASAMYRSGRDITVGNARLNTLLCQRGLDMKTLNQPKAHQTMRSLYPNHVHQVDPSYSLLYYAPKGLQRLNDSEAYKNKQGWVKKLGATKLWRYVLTDHYSSFIVCKYYVTAGETQAILWDFVQHCWRMTEGRLLFHGTPEILLLDKGSAGTASAFGNAVNRLGIELIHHSTGNSRVKGQVENANNIIETQFESGLLHEPIFDVDEINTEVMHFCNAYAAGKIPRYDSSLNRPGFRNSKIYRADIYSKIRAEQIRLLPNEEMCRYLFTSDPVEKPIRPNLTISFKHPAFKESRFWCVKHISELVPRMKVMVEPLIDTKNGSAIQIMIKTRNYKGEEMTYLASPEQYDDDAGWALGGAVFGEEYEAMADTTLDKTAKKVDQQAYPGMTEEQIKKAKKTHQQPFADKGGMTTHSDLQSIELPHYMQRQGSEIKVPNQNSVQVQKVLLDEIEIRQQVKAKLGNKLSVEQYLQITKWYPEGVLADDIDDVCERISNQPNLKIVNS